MLLFGCRHSEAAYIVHANSCRRNRFAVFEDIDWAATVPPKFNKTRKLYKWPVPREMNWAVETLAKLHKVVPQLQTLLGDPAKNFAKMLENWYSRRVIKDAGKENDDVAERCPATDQLYSMRTIRAYHGTKWAEEAELAQRMGLPPPFNPLQHVNPRMTFQHYVAPEEETPPSSRSSERRGAKLRYKKNKKIDKMLPD